MWAVAVAVGCRPGTSAAPAAAPDSSAVASADAAPADTMSGDSVPLDTLSSPTLDQLSRFVSQRWTADLDSMVARRAIRVLVVHSKMLYFEDRGRLRGASYDMIQEFEKALNKKFRTGSIPIECIFIPVPRDQLISRLADGRGDLAVGMISVTPERQKRVEFSDPVYEGVREVVVTGPGAPGAAERSRTSRVARSTSARRAATPSISAGSTRTGGLRAGSPSSSGRRTRTWRMATSWRWSTPASCRLPW